MIPKFKEVDAGCFMFENESGRWIIEHPFNGYMPTISKQWDVILEHPKEPHRKLIKFLGSFKTKISSIEFIKRQLKEDICYFNAEPVENNFYNKDYSQK